MSNEDRFYLVLWAMTFAAITICIVTALVTHTIRHCKAVDAGLVEGVLPGSGASYWMKPTP